MRLTASVVATLMAMGAGAWAQTAEEEAVPEEAPLAGAAATADGAATGEGAEQGVDEDGNPLLLLDEDGNPIETDVTASEEGLEMDGTVPVDASPGAASEDDVTATDVTEGGGPAGEALEENTADVPTDVDAEGDAIIMDGTVPVDESPEAEAEVESD